jgi:hypothetical protein
MESGHHTSGAPAAKHGQSSILRGYCRLEVEQRWLAYDELSRPATVGYTPRPSLDGHPKRERFLTIAILDPPGLSLIANRRALADCYLCTTQLLTVHRALTQSPKRSSRSQ